MKTIAKLISILSITILPAVAIASSAGRGSTHTVTDSAEAMYGGNRSLTFDSSKGSISTLPESTIEYLLERQNRNQVDEILFLIDDVQATE